MQQKEPLPEGNGPDCCINCGKRLFNSLMKI